MSAELVDDTMGTVVLGAVDRGFGAATIYRQRLAEMRCRHLMPSKPMSPDGATSVKRLKRQTSQRNA